MKQTPTPPRGLQHFFAGAVLALNAYIAFDDNEPVIGSMLATLAALVLGYFLLARFRERDRRRLDLIVHLCEGAALWLTAGHYLTQGKSYLPYITAAAGAGYFLAAWRNSREAPR